ncbi:MAG: DUF2510 domain-containing protein [Nocardiopsaceae bacterium]|nr:DUF2510 domain-containing protein [Nocardiopsaceae bacterium]
MSSFRGFIQRQPPVVRVIIILAWVAVIVTLAVLGVNEHLIVGGVILIVAAGGFVMSRLGRSGSGGYIGGSAPGTAQNGFQSPGPGFQAPGSASFQAPGSASQVSGFGYQPPGSGAQGDGAPQPPGQPEYAASSYGAQAGAQASGQPAPDWYPDPRDPALVRWWDGQAWTPSTRPRR